MAGEMRLVGEAGFGGSFGERRAVAKQQPGTIQPPHQEIAVRRGMQHGPERPRQGETVDAGDGFQFRRMDVAGEMRLHEGAGGPHLSQRLAARRREEPPGMRRQAFGDIDQQVVEKQAVRIRALDL